MKLVLLDLAVFIIGAAQAMPAGAATASVGPPRARPRAEHRGVLV